MSDQKPETVHKLLGLDAWKEALSSHDVVFVDWYATWCGPCKAIAPKVTQWSVAHPSIYFAKVDVDDNPELSQEYGIRAMPTFMVFKNGEKVDEFIGVNPNAVEQLILKHKPEDKAEEASE